ncbi:MAG: WD40 repeat domain-containing protein, partial [Planctomycetia bacterium]
GALLVSQPVSFDTVYGGAWSPDGTLVSFGCTDNSLRAIEAATGRQVLFQGAHEDWVLDTVFAPKGGHVISLGRDMSVKLTELATQRFVDNITSITPGALRGGLMAVDRHPTLEHVVAAGADGTPRAYRIHRHATRVIGDDANLIFPLYPVSGRVFSLRFSPDGKRVAAVGGLDGRGELVVSSYGLEADVPKPILDIMAKVPGESRTKGSQRSPAEWKALDDFRDASTKLLAKVEVPETALYAVAFHPQSGEVAVARHDQFAAAVEPPDRRHPLAVGREAEVEDPAAHGLQREDVVRVVADHALGVPVDPVGPGRAIGSGGDDMLEHRMPIHRHESAAERPRCDRGDVVDEPLGGKFRELHAHVAAQRNHVVSLGRKHRVEHPVLVRALEEHLFPGGRVDRPQRVVGAAEGDEFAVGRPATAVDGVERDGPGEQKRAVGDAPDLHLAHPRGVAARDRELRAIGGEPHPLDPLGEAHEPELERGCRGSRDIEHEHLVEAGDREQPAVGGEVERRHDRLPRVDRRMLGIDPLSGARRRVVLGARGDPPLHEVNVGGREGLAPLGHL